MPKQVMTAGYNSLNCRCRLMESNSAGHSPLVLTAIKTRNSFG